MLSTAVAPVLVENALSRYRSEIGDALGEVAKASDAKARDGETGFGPGHRLPPASAVLDRFFAASDIAIADLGVYRGKRLRLLDLMRNPRTRTTKTFASLVIVARAVEFLRHTDERVMIVSPSSGNKATALRDAVRRAYESGLTTPDRLQILVVVPGSTSDKLWSSPLSTDPGLCERNPVVTYDGVERADVKALACALVDGHAAEIRERHGVHLWYTLDIDNYKVADQVRAFVERDFLPPCDGRLHVHTVSSGYGLLGHHLGATRMDLAGSAETSARYFLVQHLDTPDMVLNLYFGSTDRRNLPVYRYDWANQVYRQQDNPRFPTVTADPAENIESTFYTRRPVTAPEMSDIIRAQGGGGMVVSAWECRQRYAQLREMLAIAGVDLPADSADLREWSLVMALTGIINGIDRGLVGEDDILVHGTGTYQRTDYTPIPAGGLNPVDGVDELVAVAARAARSRPEPR